MAKDAIHTWSELIEAFGGPTAYAKYIGVPFQTGYKMYERDAVHSAHWEKIVESAPAAKKEAMRKAIDTDDLAERERLITKAEILDDVTYDLLVRLQRSSSAKKNKSRLRRRLAKLQSQAESQVSV